MLLEPLKNDIINYYNSGMSAVKISGIIGCSTTGVMRVLGRNNVTIRGRNEYLDNARKIFFDTKFFDVIDTEAKAYFLGFLFADGCIRNTLREILFTLHIKDKEIIDKFCLFINYPIDNIKYVDMKDHNDLMVKLSLNSTHMVQSLIKHGCTPNKSLTLKFPITVSDNMLRHFCRGYFDGDGSIFKLGGKFEWRLQVLGTLDFLKSYGRVAYFTNRTKIYKHVNIYRLLYCAKQDVLDLGNWLYNGSTIYLKRKHDKFLEFVEYMDNIK